MINLIYLNQRDRDDDEGGGSDDSDSNPWNSYENPKTSGEVEAVFNEMSVRNHTTKKPHKGSPHKKKKQALVEIGHHGEDSQAVEETAQENVADIKEAEEGVDKVEDEVKKGMDKVKEGLENVEDSEKKLIEEVQGDHKDETPSFVEIGHQSAKKAANRRRMSKEECPGKKGHKHSVMAPSFLEIKRGLDEDNEGISADIPEGEDDAWDGDEDHESD